MTAAARQQAPYLAKRQRTLRREKKCIWCRVSAAGAGHALCARHRKDVNARSFALYWELRAAGLCTRSGCGARTSGYLCAEHAEARRQRRAERSK